jgi:GH25 family lysozyme M1 (1,4-beta-N-acetylmuramidase)
MIAGIDYASVDGNQLPNFHAAVAAGARFVGIRGAYGYAGKVHSDPTITRDAPGWRVAGAQVFSYLFLTYDCAPEMQADTLATTYMRGGSDLPIALDLEMDTPPPGTTPASRIAYAERALARLQQHYGARGVMIYTSAEQWLDHFGDLDSAALGACPLWLKTPYAWREHNPPKLDSAGPLGTLPRPWRRPGSPGAWIQQFQGDAIGWAGMSSTVDVNQFLISKADPGDPRWAWVVSRFFSTAPDLATWQRARGLMPDGVVGPATFAQLCR